MRWGWTEGVGWGGPRGLWVVSVGFGWVLSCVVGGGGRMGRGWVYLIGRTIGLLGGLL